MMNPSLTPRDCPRCAGAVEDTSDRYGRARRCVNCGWYGDAYTPDPAWAPRGNTNRTRSTHRRRHQCDLILIHFDQRPRQVAVTWCTDVDRYGGVYAVAIDVEGCGWTVGDTDRQTSRIAAAFRDQIGLALRYVADAIRTDPRPPWAIAKSRQTARIIGEDTTCSSVASQNSDSGGLMDAGQSSGAAVYG